MKESNIVGWLGLCIVASTLESKERAILGFVIVLAAWIKRNFFEENK